LHPPEKLGGAVEGDVASKGILKVETIMAKRMPCFAVMMMQPRQNIEKSKLMAHSVVVTRQLIVI
jgi:hypothetical protein